MKRVISILLAVLVLAALAAGCAKNNEEPAGDALARIKAKGELSIGMEGCWSPWTYHDENDKLVGFDTEVGEAIAAKLGVKANFVEGDWDGLLPSIDSGRLDMVINGVDITPERAEKYAFSTPYAFEHTVLIVAGDNTEISVFADLNGKKTANSIGSTYMELAEKYGAEVTGADTLEMTLDLVFRGDVDATLNAELSFLDYMGVHPDANLKVVDRTPEATQIAIPMKNDDDAATLRAAVDQAIRELREEGVLAQLSIKYFGSDITATN